MHRPSKRTVLWKCTSLSDWLLHKTVHVLQILHVAAIGKFKLRPSLKQAIFLTLLVIWCTGGTKSKEFFTTVLKIWRPQQSLRYWWRMKDSVSLGKAPIAFCSATVRLAWQTARQWEAICYLRRCLGDCEGSNTGLFWILRCHAYEID